MSCDRVTRFICDGCKKVVLMDEYKLPKGFVYLPVIVGKREKVEHHCEDCVELEKKQNNGLFNMM